MRFHSDCLLIFYACGWSSSRGCMQALLELLYCVRAFLMLHVKEVLPDYGSGPDPAKSTEQTASEFIHESCKDRKQLNRSHHKVSEAEPRAM